MDFMIMDDFAMTDPNGIGSFFSQAALPPLQGEGGFGPGNYSGGYTGSELGGGHAIYWGAFDDVGSVNQTIASLHTTTPVIGGASALGTIIEAVSPLVPPSSTGETVLEPSSSRAANTIATELQTTEPSSTGETVLEASSSRAVNPASIATELQEEMSGRSAMGPSEELSVRSKATTAIEPTKPSPGERFLLNPNAPPEEQIYQYMKWDRRPGARQVNLNDPTAEEIFAEYYNPDEPWNPVDAISKALNIPYEQAQSRTGSVEQLWDDLYDIWIDHSEPAGTAATTEPTEPPAEPRWADVDAPGDDELKLPDLPDEPGDIEEPIPGDIELQPIAPEPEPLGPLESIYSGDGSSVISRVREPLPPEQPEEQLPPEPKPEGGKGETIEMQEMSTLDPEFVSEIRGGPTPFRGTLEDTSPMLIDDIPTGGKPFSFNDIDWEKVSKPTIDSLGDYFESDAGIDGAFLGSEGIGQNLGLFSRTGFQNFLKQRMTDIAVGAALQPLFNWIDDATDTPWVSRGIQGAMSIYGLVAAGDPFGVIMAPIMWGIQDYMMQRQRILENDHPDSNYGKLYGYVREGHKWFPAYITRSERDQGKLFGSDTTQIRMSYGTDLKFKHQKGTGNIIPYFDEGTYRQKDFHVWDDEADITNNSSGKDWRDQADPLRDFYFLSEEETHEFLHNLGGGDTASQYLNDRDHEFTKEEQDAIRASQTSAFGMMQVYDDPTWGETWEKHGTDEQKEYYAKYGAYVGTVQDIRSGLELWHDYLTSEPGNIYTTRQDENQYSGAKGFRRAMNESGYLGYEGDKKGQGRRPEGATLQEMQDDAIAKNSSPASGANLTNAEMQGTQEGLWLVKEYAKSRDILIESQKRAGLKMHFDKIYKVPQNAPTDKEYFFPSGKHTVGTQPWRLYTDGTWEIGDTETDVGLREALRLIESSGDSSLVGTRDYRNAAQRDYLANKAYCRYLGNKLDVLGIYDAVTSDSWVKKDLLADGIKLDKEGHAAFGFDPEWSYADDYEEWGYNTKPKRSSIAAFKANKYADDDSYDFAGREPEDWDNYQRGNTAGEDFALDTSALGKAQTKPQWLLDMNRYIIGGGPAPDEVSGRFKTREDYDKAVAILSAEEVPAPWDVFDEGVPDGDFVFDTVQNQYVPPKDKTPGLIYDAESGKYIKPDTEDDAAADAARKAARQAARQAARDSKKAADDPAILPVDVGEQSPEDFIKSLGQGGGGWDAGFDWSFEDKAKPTPDPIEPEPTPEIPAPPPERHEHSAPTVTIPDDHPHAGAHVHEEAPPEEPHQDYAYVHTRHADMNFEHSAAPHYLPPTHVKVI